MQGAGSSFGMGLLPRPLPVVIDRIISGVIGTGRVIKNTLSIKDVNIDEDTYIKGANKIKNLIIHSSIESPSQVGEGCELVSVIIVR